MLRDKVRTANALSVNEIYESIQGEGLLVGTPSIFIRLQGCNLRCPWCDQPEALSFSNATIPVEGILQKVQEFPARHVVITGGEPFAHQNLHVLVRALIEEGFSLQIETNGTLWNEGLDSMAEQVHITCSPKAVANFFVNPRVIKHTNELKFVVDEEFSSDVVLREEFRGLLLAERVVLQPEGNKVSFLRKALDIQRELSLKGFKVRVIPQVHKLLGLP